MVKEYINMHKTSLQSLDLVSILTSMTGGGLKSLIALICLCVQPEVWSKEKVNLRRTVLTISLVARSSSISLSYLFIVSLTYFPHFFPPMIPLSFPSCLFLLCFPPKFPPCFPYCFLPVFTSHVFLIVSLSCFPPTFPSLFC